MNIVQRFMTQNDCFKAGRKIKPWGIMVHATATPGVMSATWFDRWNKPGINKCVHAFLDDKGVLQYLPWDHRGWHAGGGGNDTHIGFEICEPAGHRYSGAATMVDYNVAKNQAYFDAVWENAIQLCVMLCKEFKLTERDIIDHSEGHRLGIASNHADVGHWFPRHGRNMDMFRAAVKERLNDKPPAANEVLYRVQTGAFKVKANADRMETLLKEAGFPTYMVQDDGFFKVQVGAFRVKANAEALAVKIKDAGVEVYITTRAGDPVSTLAPAAPEIRIGSRVKVKPGSTTYTGGSLASFVYNTVYDVIQVNGDRIVIGLRGETTAAVHKDNIILQ